eukprot:CAMPEP_0206263740 /NCGR_PEP_ID=MMETSP0047_2-20121206/28999_1 /ASSEMBLY_ACC=CAM_ASM_000192 /TAXON_ID=195065 /ORGANISM="Chroomonas mesostigmatica_cf, Strain CCMP1168" /LENGTH=64 /DNA_ID=CAMNT_0053691341 /DNA_START=213 /DNA_END=403 /DNA_ORIENTATION=-
MVAALLEWFCAWPKLFEVIWNAYCFNKLSRFKCHDSIQIGDAGRMIEKIEKTDYNQPSSCVLMP